MPRKKIENRSRNSNSKSGQTRDRSSSSSSSNSSRRPSGNGHFHLEFKNQAQGLAWAAFKQHDILFLTGPAGTGKSHLACAFAIEQILNNEKKRIILTRPIVESGESLGYLPGDFEQKVNPYMMPMYDVIDKLVGKEGPWRDKINASMEVAPLAYMRGRSGQNSEIIITPTGTTTFGEIKVGDFVIGSNGSPTKVLAVYPQGVLKTYRMVFTDGTEVVCSGDHLWPTMTLNEKRHNKGFTIKTTDQIRETILNKHNQKIHRMMFVSNPVEFESRNVDIDPYLLGCLLGDGCLNKQTISLSTNDTEILDECKNRLPIKNEFVFCGKYDYRIKFNGNSELKKCLKKYDLLGKKSPQKFIPEDYKINSKEVRLQILQGLLDTDGTIGVHRSGKCRIQFTSTSKQLAEDVMFLTRSLGGYAYCRLRKFDKLNDHEYNGKKIRHVHNAYVVDIMIEMCPFKLNRKAVKHVNLPKPTKMVKDVIPCGESECTCIRVEADDRLFLTNGFNVTHNTFDDAICIFDEAQNASMMQLKLFMTRFGENSKLIINGDPNQSDIRGNVALIEVMKRLESVDGIGRVEFKPAQIVRHPLVGKVIEKLEQE